MSSKICCRLVTQNALHKILVFHLLHFFSLVAFLEPACGKVDAVGRTRLPWCFPTLIGCSEKSRGCFAISHLSSARSSGSTASGLLGCWYRVAPQRAWPCFWTLREDNPKPGGAVAPWISFSFECVCVYISVTSEICRVVCLHDFGEVISLCGLKVWSQSWWSGQELLKGCVGIHQNSAVNGWS